MKIHFLSNSLHINSGFANVTRYLATELTKLGHQVSITGMQTGYTSQWHYGIENLPLAATSVDDVTQYILNLHVTKPDVAICIFQADTGENIDFVTAFKNSVWYPPVEGSKLPFASLNGFQRVIANGGNIVAQCKWGQKEMEKYGLSPKYIYHGFNDKIFKPLNLDRKEDMRYCFYSTEAGKELSNPLLLHHYGCYDCQLQTKEQTSCKYFKEEEITILRHIQGKWTEKRIKITDLPYETTGKYVFGFVGQNIGLRKRIERLLKAYSIFIQSRQLKDRTIIHLHTMPMVTGVFNGINLIQIIQDLGIQDNVIFSYGSFRSSTWSETAMSILYNTFDCNSSASSGEGYGLPTLESMACGIPQIGPKASSFIELISEDDKRNIGPRGILAKGDWQFIQDSSFRFLVDEQDLSNCMKLMYNGENKDYQKNCLEFVKPYTWEKVAMQWDKLLKEIK